MKNRKPAPRPLTLEQEKKKHAKIVATEARRIVRDWRLGKWEGFTAGHHVVSDDKPAELREQRRLLLNALSAAAEGAGVMARRLIRVRFEGLDKGNGPVPLGTRDDPAKAREWREWCHEQAKFHYRLNVERARACRFLLRMLPPEKPAATTTLFE